MKYHVIGYIVDEKRTPVRILMLANPVKTKMTLLGRKVIVPTFDVQPDSACFLCPYTLEWFDVIDKYQCDRDTNQYPIWEPDMSLFKNQEQITMSGQRLMGYLHVDLVKEINTLKMEKQQNGKATEQKTNANTNNNWFVSTIFELSCSHIKWDEGIYLLH